MIPISVPDEYQKGLIRVKIYVDEVDKIPYDEEPLTEEGECSYNMKTDSFRESIICAVSLIKQSTATDEVLGSEKGETGTTDADGELVGGDRDTATTEDGDVSSRRSHDGSDPSPVPQSGDANEDTVETVRSARSDLD